VTDEPPDTLATLRPNYLKRLAERRTLLAATMAAMAEQAQHDEAAKETYRLVHSMGSSAAIYGYPDLSEAARAAERLYDDPESAGAERAEALAHLSEQARLVLEGKRE
jgi:hypothetical protein